MMRSLFSAVSGLQNHQTRMDVIGNNVSNVNTTGFKKGRVTFQDILSQTVSGAAKPTDERGGINPQQVGLGMNVSSIDTIMTQGSLQTTGKNTDLAITGEGFFVMQEGEQTYYTRAGNFMLDSEGLLVNGSGLKVQGWNAVTLDNGERYINTSAPLDDLVIPIGEKLEARSTSQVTFKSNLNSETDILPENPTADEIITSTHSTSITVYDDYGTPLRLVVDFVREDTNQWRATATVEDPDGNPMEDVQVFIEDPELGGTNNDFVVNFNNDGTINRVTLDNGELDDLDQLQITLQYTNPAELDPAGIPVTRQFDMVLGTSGEVTDSITQFASQTTTKLNYQDGYTMGYLESFTIDDSGTITGAYDNGEIRTLGQTALATFVNPGGLEKSGESLYVYSNNSGLANIGTAGSQGKGTIYAGALEMSNVDLSETFTDMIVTERGFQANSRVVTTTDEMLVEVLSLKR